MINPCPRRILCPPGTGTDSPGTNYSSEHVDVPEYPGVYYPPDAGYNTYSACRGLCISTVSQEDADLCAARQAALCIGQATGKSTYGNTVQTCAEPGTGRTVIVPAYVFLAGSVAEANAQALSYATKLQLGTTIPPGLHIVPPAVTPPSGGTGTTPPNVIPTPGPVPRPRPPTPPTSHCKPCDDTVGVSSFSQVCDVPAGVLILSWESPPLRCGQWLFSLVTNDGGSIDDPQATVTLVLVVNDPSRTYVDWGTLVACEQMAYTNPCASGPLCDVVDTAAFGKAWNQCCSDTIYDCKWIECQTMPDGHHYLCRLQINYACVGGPEVPFAKKFTVNGTLINPLPSTP